MADRRGPAMPVTVLPAGRPAPFPPVESALQSPDGLLAAGGDLRPGRLLDAYARGIFPWYSRGQPILWWSPAERTIFRTAAMHVPRRLARWLRGCAWRISADTAFDAVIDACAAPRGDEAGTWITSEMREAYVRLHGLGHAHSVEAWDGSRLVGGLYGVSIGRMVYGESMFSAAPNGSKVALLALAHVMAREGAPWLDAQVASAHLFTLGAQRLPRKAFCEEAARLASEPGLGARWGALFEAVAVPDLAG
jgi:leucyl/phenylalanyl-tRNA--protein transferase